MAVVYVGGSSLLADSQPKLVGLVWGLAATWRRVSFCQTNVVNYGNSLTMVIAP